MVVHRKEELGSGLQMVLIRVGCLEQKATIYSYSCQLAIPPCKLVAKPQLNNWLQGTCVLMSFIQGIYYGFG